MRYSRSEWVAFGRFTIGVSLISALPIYVSAFVSNWSLVLAMGIHAVVIALYVGLIALFGARSLIEMAILPVVIAISASLVVPSYRAHQQRHQTKPSTFLTPETANRYCSATPPNHRLQSGVPPASHLWTGALEVK